MSDTVRRALADGVAIGVFATSGQLSHRGSVSVGGYAADALTIAVGWFAAFALFRGRFLPTWIVGATLGVLVRMVVLGHYRWNELVFWLVTLGFLGAVAAAIRTVSDTVGATHP